MSLELNRSLTSFERILNKLGYFPIISTLSGILRFFYAKLQIACGVGTAVIFFIASLLERDPIRSDQNRRYAASSVKYFIHGIANFIRSIVEIIPFVNLSTIPYDLSNRFSYNPL